MCRGIGAVARVSSTCAKLFSGVTGIVTNVFLPSFLDANSPALILRHKVRLLIPRRHAASVTVNSILSPTGTASTVAGVTSNISSIPSVSADDPGEGVTETVSKLSQLSRNVSHVL